MPKQKLYILLDARAGIAGLDSDVDVTAHASIMLTGTAVECCDSANRNEYGEGCVVADMNGEIQWSWNASGRWVAEQ